VRSLIVPALRWPVLVSVALATALAAATAAPPVAAAAPAPKLVMAENVPDPTVVRVGDRYVAAGTSSSWAPLFPLFESRDLVNWRRIGAVLPRAPSWTRGHFWAPELYWDGSRLYAYFSASRRGAKACIGVATAPGARGPWRDRGIVTCRPQGMIDVAPVTDEHGQRWLAWKAQGPGGGIHIQPLRADGLRAAGTATSLLTPDARWEGGVTEGPNFVRRDGEWYLLYSGGGCCRPPCGYALGVARAPALQGPYEKHPGNPILRDTSSWRCMGHGTLVDAGGDRWHLLHHGRRPGEVGDLRRQVLLTRMTWAADGWPAFRGEALGGAVPRAAEDQARASSAFSERFRSRRLAPGWEWPFNRPPDARPGAGGLRLGCERTDGGTDLLTRQVAADAFAASAGIATGKGQGRTPFAVGLAVHSPDGTARGVEVAAGRVRTFGTRGRRTVAGRWVRVARATKSRPEPSVRVVVSVGRDGRLQATAGGSRTVAMGSAASGQPATRIALTCRGRGSGQVEYVRARP
jgi:xylan 1,4-beta-xylosidase